MTVENKLLAQKIYLILGALFITSLVVSNLIFQKFFYWHPFDIQLFGEQTHPFFSNLTQVRLFKQTII